MKSRLSLELSIEEAQDMIKRLLGEVPRSNSLDLGEIEVKIKRPVVMNTLGASTSLPQVDIGIVIALDEEFSEIFPQIESTSVFIEGINQYFYQFERGANDSEKYLCVATFIGGMGIGKSAVIADRLINQFKPATVINIGIAGSMDKDVIVGDVVLAEQADDYLYAAKAIISDNSHDFGFQFSGDPYKSSLAYVRHAQNLKYAYSQANTDWLATCEAKLKELVSQQVLWGLLHKGLIRERPALMTGDIASGSIVGATDVFVQWLKSRNRKYLAVEMEAAGVMSAAYTRAVDTLIIRGISDFSDHRKAEFDSIGSGALRRYAMNNAISLLWTLMDLRLLKSAKHEGT
jgi:nucleoside phosphorylase